MSFLDWNHMSWKYLLILFDSHLLFLTHLGDGNKSSSNPLHTDWTTPKQQTNDKRKPLDDSYAGVSIDLFARFFHFSLRLIH